MPRILYNKNPISTFPQNLGTKLQLNIHSFLLKLAYLSLNRKSRKTVARQSEFFRGQKLHELPAFSPQILSANLLIFGFM